MFPTRQHRVSIFKFSDLASKLQASNAKQADELYNRELLPAFRFPLDSDGNATRHYHTLEARNAHQLLIHDLLSRQTDRPVEVEAAIWLRKSIYDPQDAENLEPSKQLANHLFSALGIKEHKRNYIEQLVGATEENASTYDQKIILDLDNSILGETKRKFDAYQSAIRKEQEPEGELAKERFDAQYDSKRLRTIEDLLSNGPLFKTPEFKAKYGALANKNLERERTRLTLALGAAR